MTKPRTYAVIPAPSAVTNPKLLLKRPIDEQVDWAWNLHPTAFERTELKLRAFLNNAPR